MAKSLKSVYFESSLIIQAEEENVNINLICNEALRMALNATTNPVGAEINKQADIAKDNQTMIKYSCKLNSPMGRAVWAKAVAMYAEKYDMTQEDVVKKYR